MRIAISLPVVALALCSWAVAHAANEDRTTEIPPTASLPTPTTGNGKAMTLGDRCCSQYDDMVLQLLELVKKIPVGTTPKSSDEGAHALYALGYLKANAAIPELIKRFDLSTDSNLTYSFPRQPFDISASKLSQWALANIGPTAAQPTFSHFTSTQTNADEHIAVIVRALGNGPEAANEWLQRKLKTPGVTEMERDAVKKLLQALEDAPKRAAKENTLQ